MIKRGDIYDVDLEPVRGSEQGKRRPCVVIQNDIANNVSPVTIVATITGSANVKKVFPVLVAVKKGQGGMIKDSFIQCNQIRTVDKGRLVKYRGTLPDDKLNEIDDALVISLGIHKVKKM